MNAFRKMQERLKEEGWYVGWNEPCCQSCAWSCLPDYLDEEEKVDVDYSKVLFNHSQDCEVYVEGEECPVCEGEGYDMETDEDCMECFGRGEIEEGFDASEYDTSIDGFICNSPEQQTDSMFCFDGSKKGVENFKAIIPIIEECGVTIDSFDESGKTRIQLSW